MPTSSSKVSIYKSNVFVRSSRTSKSNSTACPDASSRARVVFAPCSSVQKLIKQGLGIFSIKRSSPPSQDMRMIVSSNVDHEFVCSLYDLHNNPLLFICITPRYGSSFGGSPEDDESFGLQCA